VKGILGNSGIPDRGKHISKKKTALLALLLLFLLGIVSVSGADGIQGKASIDPSAGTADSSQYTKPYFESAKDSIRQKAVDVARQIEIYIRLNPNMTVKDLQADPYFQSIAVQPVGKTGYTAVTDYDTLICRFHKNPALIDKDLHELADILQGFWGIMSRTKGAKRQTASMTGSNQTAR